ncbi:sensor histidine kinase [Dactylosporangium aurantiacum]|uniref:Sensor histidine kinase n=1 Tax=Dactylosporangium aurantiacum TaxID=35754 RepID=A0A9Q9MJT0_9ACTN|nr:sensor histidine kinase [Dactylosporangium aurantiacum]MDG6108903.1 sensor histidine kinase [Dactylosporangium aurantiacum]UWZ52197.1 sensor histidine kinase [Dactylosporangium aurantiacum]
MSHRSAHAPGDRFTEPFVHEALLYHDQASYLDGTMKFIYAGIWIGEPVAVAVPPANMRLIRERLGAFAETVTFHDITEAGRNPGRIIPWLLSRFMDEHPGHRVRVVGEPIWRERSDEEYPACVQHEAMINVAFAGRAASILCPYDTDRLHPHMVKDSYATHPVMIEQGARFPSDGYDPYGITDAYNLPLSEPPLGASTLRFEVDDLVKVRRAVAEVGLEADLPPDRISDLQSAVNELATNSVMHAGGSGTLRTWHDDVRVVCEVRDFGHVTDVMAGRLRAPDGGGRGLVMVHYLADLVQRHTSQTGTTTRVHVLR